MHDLLIHELGARRIHWRYDDPSGVPDLPGGSVRGASRTVRPAADVRAPRSVRRFAPPRAA